LEERGGGVYRGHWGWRCGCDRVRKEMLLIADKMKAAEAG